MCDQATSTQPQPPALIPIASGREEEKDYKVIHVPTKGTHRACTNFSGNRTAASILIDNKEAVEEIILELVHGITKNTVWSIHLEEKSTPKAFNPDALCPVYDVSEKVEGGNKKKVSIYLPTSLTKMVVNNGTSITHVHKCYRVWRLYTTGGVCYTMNMCSLRKHQEKRKAQMRNPDQKQSLDFILN